MLKSSVKRLLFTYLDHRGYEVEPLRPDQRENKRRFSVAEHAARERWDALSAEDKLRQPDALEDKYARRLVFGRVRVFELIERLATVINPLEPELGCVSQLTHELQLATAMERDGQSETLVLCALLHDLGTILLDTDEDPINVEAGGKKTPLVGERGSGLSNCTFRWDHGDFIYLRMKAHVPADVAWLLRHHSMDLPLCEPYMDARDRALTERLFVPFERYDARKDMFALPAKRLEDYRPLIDRMFPEAIPF